MRTLGIIPARGGSKAVKRKNIRMVAGQPLIQYAIDCAIGSQLLDEFLVDTEDEEIITYCEQLHIPVVKRPGNLAADDSSIVDVVLNTLDRLEGQGKLFDAVVLLQPTAPIRTSENLDEVIRMLGSDKEVDGVISVICNQDVHPARMYTLSQDNLMNSLYPEMEYKRRQDLDEVYFRNGCFYAIKTEALRTQRSFMPRRKKAFVMPDTWLANIDSPRDLIITESLIEAWRAGKL